MKSYVALSLTAVALASPMPQADAPADCSPSVSGTFQISTILSPTKRDLEARQLAGPLTLTLKDGILRDQAGRRGYIASNYQFQFDEPVQAGTIVDSGFSLCSNDSIALGGSTVFYQCLSGSFYNLYSQSTGAQCSPIQFQAVEKSSGDVVSQISDGQPQATTATSIVSQISDGQPQAPPATSRPVVSQISDGQPQAPSATPKPDIVSQISDGQPQAPPATSKPVVVTQISDGQPQAPPATSKPAIVTQISDGQPQAPPATPKPDVVTQISDGQPQAPPATSKPAVVTQISDGQPQAPPATSKPAVVTQISDGQPQAPPATPKPIVVTQISDGQPQAPPATSRVSLFPIGNATATSNPIEYTGAAVVGAAPMGALAAGLIGLFALF